MWRLVHGLAERGCSVSVISEEVIGDVAPNIMVFSVKKAPEKPRWKSMLIFRDRVSELLKQNFHGQSVIIHSHERSLSHHVTTFHGAPITRKSLCGAVFAVLNRRLRAWKKMEKDELFGGACQIILPVSSLIYKNLNNLYPLISTKKIFLAWPGVDRDLAETNSVRAFDDRYRFLFVGKEWRRKGLLKAIEIVEMYRLIDPRATLTVYGVYPDDVSRHLRFKSFVTFAGWDREISWNQFDALIHPAVSEPFGMVIVEALAFGTPVVMSEVVGASDFAFKNAETIPLDAPISSWVRILRKLTVSSDRRAEVHWTWDDLVDLHVDTIYKALEVDAIE